MTAEATTLTYHSILDMRDYCKGVTPGPWRVVPDSRPDIMAPAGKGGYMDGGHVVAFASMAKYADAWGNASDNMVDAEFIARARTDFPLLIDFAITMMRELGWDNC